MIVQELQLRKIIRESIRQNKVQYRKPRNGNLVFEVKNTDGLIKKIRLKESYIIKILGIKKKRLMESIQDPAFQREVLREHLLFESWWSPAAKFIGDTVDSIAKKAENASDILKRYGENAKGVIATIWASVEDSSALESFKGGVSKIMSKAVAAINKPIGAIERRIKELGMNSLAEILEKTRLKIVEMFDSLDGVSGWKGLLTAIAGALCFGWIKEKILPGLNAVVDALKGDIKDFAKMMADKAASVAGDYKEVFNIGPGDPREVLKSFIKEKLASLVPDIVKEKVTSIAGDAIASFAGPVAWLKKVYDVFQSSRWVLEKLAGAISYANFKI